MVSEKEIWCEAFGITLERLHQGETPGCYREGATCFGCPSFKKEVFQKTKCEGNRTQEKLGTGVYELPSGEIFVVKSNREGTHLYAKKLVESNERFTETGKRVNFDFVYERGAIFRIKPENRMPLDRAKTLMIRYGRCIVCGRLLKVAESVERGIGPVCIKAFARREEK